MRLPVNFLLYRLLRGCRFPVEWEISVGTVLFRRSPRGGREYLILHYPSGHFDFPKGHMENGETEEETARRETLEETGIAPIRLLPHRESIRYFYRARGNEAVRRLREGRGTWIFKVVHFYPAEAPEEAAVLLSHEHIGSVWLPYEAALRKATFENARSILRATERFLASEA
jgi:bis(5'-nucleosidyl)-tetraphosphatase